MRVDTGPVVVPAVHLDTEAEYATVRAMLLTGGAASIATDLAYLHCSDHDDQILGVVIEDVDIIAGTGGTLTRGAFLYHCHGAVIERSAACGFGQDVSYDIVVEPGADRRTP